MRHIAILVLVLVAAATANAAALNCTKLSSPAHNFYAPTGACANETGIKACLDAYATCVKTPTTCGTAMPCVSTKMRCLEAAAPTTTTCGTWSAMFSNEKLYLAAGGDYNGSTLELSCQNAVCSYIKAYPTIACAEADYKSVCVDAVSVVSPAPTPKATYPAGALVVTFQINGNKTLFAALLATEAGRTKARGLVMKILITILGIAESKIVITNIRVGSLVVDFYTTDPSLNIDSVRAKIDTAKTMNQTALFGELAAAAGIPVSELSVGEFTVGDPSTPAPSTGAPGTTPSPDLTDSASLVASTFAIVAALLALLL